MSPKVVTIGPRESARAAAARMARRRIRHLVVADDGELQGLISASEAASDGASSQARVEDLMTPRVVSVSPETSLDDAIDRMRAERVGALTVVEDGRLVGIVTATDVLDELGRPSPRSPFPGWVPKRLKRESSLGAVPIAPAHIRMAGARLSREQRAAIRDKLGRKLGKFGHAIERISLRVSDVNGPRGGIDQLCRIKVVLSHFPSIVAEAQDASADVAVSGAVAAAERAVRRTLQRQRMKPIKARARSTARPR